MLLLGSGMPIEQLTLDAAPQLFTEERVLRISYIIGFTRGCTFAAATN